MNNNINKLNSKISEKKLSMPNAHLLWVYLRSVYFAETENFVVENTVNKGKC